MKTIFRYLKNDVIDTFMVLMGILGTVVSLKEITSDYKFLIGGITGMLTLHAFALILRNGMYIDLIKRLEDELEDKS